MMETKPNRPSNPTDIETLATGEYKYGFETAVEYDSVRKGLNEDIIRELWEKKKEPEWKIGRASCRERV